MTTTIRTAMPTDAPALFDAWEDMRAYQHSRDPRIIPAPISRDDFIGAIDAMVSRPGSATFIAEDNGALVGFIRGLVEMNQTDRLPDRHATVGYLYVAPTHRRTGLGKLLFHSVSAWAATQPGVRHIEMSVIAADPDAEGFWRSLGFTPFLQRLHAPLVPA